MGLRKQWLAASKDMVIFHTFPRGKVAPHLSPFTGKLETYMKMAQIPYEIDFKKPFGPKGKCPWITFNGEEIADSELCIEHLAKHFGKDFSADLTPEQKATAKAIQVMCDEHLVWNIALWRFVEDKGKSLPTLIDLPFVYKKLLPLAAKRTKSAAKTQGYGRFNEEERGFFVRKELQALQSYLGDKSFMMGESPVEVDCCVFGHLTQFKWGAPGSTVERIFMNEFPVLDKYCERMKDTFWEDWDDCLGGKKKNKNI